MNDFKVIKFGGDLFNIEHYNYLHGQSMAFLSGTLADQKPCKKVVVSHHVPTYLNYPQQYKNSLLSEAFAVELYNFIKEAGPDHWIFGHHHDNIPDFKISKTTLHTNQLGYVRYKENSSFSTDKIIDL